MISYHSWNYRDLHFTSVTFTQNVKDYKRGDIQTFALLVKQKIYIVMLFTVDGGCFCQVTFSTPSQLRLKTLNVWENPTACTPFVRIRIKIRFQIQ